MHASSTSPPRDHRFSRSSRRAATLTRAALTGALVALSACSHASGLLTQGARAPEVSGLDAEGKTVRLSDVRGRPAVVYFYPKDDTPGCTKETCGFRDAFDKYTAQGITIFGVSRDSSDSHRVFRGK